ncbi:MAG: flagellin [Fibrobacterales bacterium]
MTRINHNISAMITQASLGRSNNALQTSLERLSTGLRVNRASDDAAGLSVSEQLRTQVRGTRMAIKNAGDGTALLRIAEGAANEISSMLQRMRELAIQSDNDTLTSTDRGYLDQEFQALKEEIQRTSLTTQYNGVTLIDGAAGSFGVSGGAASVLHVGANNRVGIDTFQVSIMSVTIGALGLSSAAITGRPGVSIAVDQLDNALTSVNAMRSDIGALMNRLDHAINNLHVSETNMQSAESVIRDVDFAYETTQFTRNQILTQASTSMLSQANSVPQSVLSLLQG